MPDLSGSRYTVQRAVEGRYAIREKKRKICVVKRSEAQSERENLLDRISFAFGGRDGVGKAARAVAGTRFRAATPDGQPRFTISKRTGIATVRFDIADAADKPLGALLYKTFRTAWEIRGADGQILAHCRQPVGWFGMKAPKRYDVSAPSGEGIAHVDANTAHTQTRDTYTIEITDPAFDRALLLAQVVASDFILPR